MTYTRCIILLADGARPDVFEELLSAGELPNINRHIIEQGTYTRAVSAFPSTTGPAHMPFLMGCLPATCNIPGIRWFDRRKYAKYGHGSILSFGSHGRYRSYVGIETFLINSDMRNDVYNVFEILPRSYSIFNSINRGIGARNLTRIMRVWYWYYGHLTDRWRFVDAEAVEKIGMAVKKDFDFLFAVLPGIDEYAHLNHPRHEYALQQYRFLDKAVGDLITQLKYLKKYDGTLIWIVSDHGLTATHTHFCVNTFLESRGIKTFYFPLIYRRDFAAVNMVSGNGMTHLYFRKADGEGRGAGWANPATAEDIEEMYPGLLDELAAEPAVDILAVKNGAGEVVAKSKRGTARMRLSGEGILYIVNGSDPFGYNFQNPPIPPLKKGGEGGFHNSRSILESTINSDYPDAPYQLLHIFTSPRSGDVVLSATPGYDLRLGYEHPEHKGSHGSLHREHMMVPVACNARVAGGPALAPDGAGPIRTVDIFPTYLKLMGYDIPANIDGRALI